MRPEVAFSTQKNRPMIGGPCIRSKQRSDERGPERYTVALMAFGTRGLDPQHEACGGKLALRQP